MTTLPEALEGTGLTYRQLDHWIRRGWLKPYQDGGSGNYRAWPNTELDIAALMHRLITAGFKTANAHAIARLSIEAGERIIGLNGGVRVVIGKAPTNYEQEGAA